MTERRRFLALVAVAFALAAVPAGVGTYAELTDRECIAVAFDASGDTTAPSEPACDGWGESGESSDGELETASTDRDDEAPRVDDYWGSTGEQATLRFLFETDEQLEAATVSIVREGASESWETTLDGSGDGAVGIMEGEQSNGYIYTASRITCEPGTYTLTLETATDGAGNDGANDESVEIEIDDVSCDWQASE